MFKIKFKEGQIREKLCLRRYWEYDRYHEMVLVTNAKPHLTLSTTTTRLGGP